MSSAFRFHTSPAMSDFADTIALRKRKRDRRSTKRQILIGADSKAIADESGTHPITFYHPSSDCDLITLTRRERDLIFLENPGKKPPLAIEDVYPWLPRQYYQDNARKNLKNLIYIFSTYIQHMTEPRTASDKSWNTICNAVRYKKALDSRFYFSWNIPIQDTFVLEESRPDRRVIALDFNSMYASCMLSEFPDPATLMHVILNRDAIRGEHLPIGLYRCTLHPPISDFINKYNPFRCFFYGRYLGASLTEPLSVDLNEFEVKFFHRHFERVELVDAVVSSKGIRHPLAREVQRLHNKRRHYLTHGNKTLADREKFHLTLLSSCSHRPTVSRKTFLSYKACDQYLSKHFGILKEEGSFSNLAESWLDGRKGITLTQSPDHIILHSPDPKSGTACFEFNQRIVARSRIVLLKMMEKLLKTDSNIEICYANIDSIHFSLPTSNIDATLNMLHSEASYELGSYRIEAVANCGLWLEPGRYWLYSDDLKRHRNRGISRFGGPFSEKSVHVASRKIGNLHIPIRKTFEMKRSMSDAWEITEDERLGFARQRILRVGANSTLEEILEQLEKNRGKGIPRRMRAFKKLRKKIKNCGVTPPRDPAI